MWAVVTFHSGMPHLVRIDQREGAQRLARRLKANGSSVACYRWAHIRFTITKADLS
jgi:hypothetical protein